MILTRKMMTPTSPTLSGRMAWIGLALALALALWFGLSWMHARAEADQLRAWQVAMVQRIAGARGGDTPLTAQEAPIALARLLAGHPGPALPAGPQLAAVVTPPIPAKDARTEISRLRRTQSTGSAAGDARIIERDSRAAWTGWE